MDKPHGINFLILRPWLFWVAIADLMLLGAIVALNQLHSRGCLSQGRLLEFGGVVG
jgi:hypothetical protein